MTNPVTPQDYAALLESLRVTEEGPRYVNGFDVFTPIERLKRNINLNRDSFKGDKNVLHFCDLVDVLLLRIEYLEANRKPTTLLEDVKACMRAGMDAENKRYEGAPYVEMAANFRKLSEAGDK